MQTLKLLFLSCHSSHKKIFSDVIREMEKVAHLDCKILNYKDLSYRSFGALSSYTHELRLYSRLINQMKPDIFIVANDQGIATTFIRICNLRGIPSVVIQDGILLNRQLRGFSRFLSWKEFLPWRLISVILNSSTISSLSIHLGRQWWIPEWGMGNATAIAIMGNYYKEVLVSRGIQPNKITITGYPLLDALSKHNSKIDEASFAQLKFHKNKPLVVLITQPFVEDGSWTPKIRQIFVEWIINSIQIAGCQLIIKIHPRDNIEVYKKLVEKYDSSEVNLIRNSDLHELLEVSDAVVTVNSTAGLWALAHEKPLLVAKCFAPNMKNILEDMAININRMDELPAILSLFKNGNKPKEVISEKTKKILYEHIYRLDGKASERIARLIISLSREKNAITENNKINVHSGKAIKSSFEDLKKLKKSKQ